MDYREIIGTAKTYRLDHANVGEVCQTTFAYGTILEFGFESLDPIIPDDTCTVAVDTLGTFEGVPFFYHCRKGRYIPEDIYLKDSKALKYGAMAFLPNKQVKVMIANRAPVAVLAHDDNPKPCPANFKFQGYGWGGTEGTYYYDTVNQVGVYSADKCDWAAEKIMGGRSFQFGTTIYYYTDWMFHVGPVLWVWSARAMGLPMPITTMCMAFAAPYTQALEESTRQTGAERDAQYRQSAYMAPGSAVGYPNFTIQTKLTTLIQSQFLGNGVINPRWDLCSFYYQDFFREE